MHALTRHFDLVGCLEVTRRCLDSRMRVGWRCSEKVMYLTEQVEEELRRGRMGVGLNLAAINVYK